MFAWPSRPLRICSSLENPLIPLRAPWGFCFPLQMPACPGEPVPGRVRAAGLWGLMNASGGTRRGKKGGQGKSLLQERHIYGGGTLWEIPSHVPGYHQPYRCCARWGWFPGGPALRCLGMRGGRSLAAHPGARGGAGGSRVATRSPSTASPCSVQHPERCRRQLWPPRRDEQPLA